MKEISRMYQQQHLSKAYYKSSLLTRSCIKLKSLQSNECTLLFKNKYSNITKNTSSSSLYLNKKTHLNVLNPSSDISKKDKESLTSSSSSENGSGKNKSTTTTDLYDVDDIKGAFSPDKTSYMQEFTVRTYEVGPNRKASILTIANHLQVIYYYYFKNTFKI